MSCNVSTFHADKRSSIGRVLASSVVVAMILNMRNTHLISIAFLSLKCELNQCVYQIHHAGLLENQSMWNDQKSSDINELMNTSTVAVEQLSKLGQSLAAKERDAKQLRQALDQAKKEYNQQQTDLSMQLNQAKEEIIKLNQRLHSLQTTEVSAL